MTYKEHDIYARVCGTYSDLYELKDDGSLEDKSEDILIKNGDESIVWYEVDAVDPKSGVTTMFTQLETIEAAQRVVDASIAFLKKEHPEDYVD